LPFFVSYFYFFGQSAKFESPNGNRSRCHAFGHLAKLIKKFASCINISTEFVQEGLLPKHKTHLTRSYQILCATIFEHCVHNNFYHLPGCCRSVAIFKKIFLLEKWGNQA
jgi:hypothetical protein